MLRMKHLRLFLETSACPDYFLYKNKNLLYKFSENVPTFFLRAAGLS